MRNVVSVTLHCFSDASFIGYGVACYLRLVDEEGKVKVALVMGKARVSPLKPTTVPRLELTAATVSVRIAAMIRAELQIDVLETYYWVDNKIILGYILNQTRRYRIFVANRVREIEEHMREAGEQIEERWKYIETKENPADFASRGISPMDTERVDTWLNGPHFLRRVEEDWRQSVPDVKIKEGDPEVKVTKVNAVVVKEHDTKTKSEPWEDIIETLERRISSWNRMKRTVAWTLRFLKHAREKTGRMKENRIGKVQEAITCLDGRGLSVEELERVQEKIILLLQEKYLPDEKKILMKRREKDRVGTREEKKKEATVGEGNTKTKTPGCKEFLVQTEEGEAEEDVGSRTPKEMQERKKMPDGRVEEESLKIGRQQRQRRSKDRLGRLNPFIDSNGTMRVGGRLSNAQEDVAFRFPYIIPKKAVCTRRLIEWHHKQVAHRGKHTTVSRLREYGFWIINSSKEVGAVVYHCVRCRWLRGRFEVQLMADLPISRTKVVPPFTYCGVDLFGPVDVIEGRKVHKRYGVLFTCFSLRAVHIEIAKTLETDSFIQALRRFVARRGAVREIRSDNGSNLVGAENELRKAMEEMDHEQVRSFLNEQGGDWILWEKNTPMASHMGGIWERQIRTVKSILTSIVKCNPKKIDEEVLKTLCAEAEAIVNSRPLTLENLHDPDSSPLTPNQLLTMKSQLVAPPPGAFQQNDVYCRKRWKVAQHLANTFWTRWRKEYLLTLQPRQKWTEKSRNLKINDVVLLKEEGAKRGHWPMGRVLETHPNEDGLVRSVTLRVGKGELKRPVHKTVLLVPAEKAEDDVN